MAHRPASPPSAPARQAFATGRKMQLGVTSDGNGGFTVAVAAHGFGAVEEAKRWGDKLIELMMEIDATHGGSSQRN